MIGSARQARSCRPRTCHWERSREGRTAQRSNCSIQPSPPWSIARVVRAAARRCLSCASATGLRKHASCAADTKRGVRVNGWGMSRSTRAATKSTQSIGVLSSSKVSRAGSGADALHPFLTVALTGGDAAWQGLRNAGKFRLAELDLQCAKIFLKVSGPLGSGNGNDVVTLREQPGQRQLCGRAPFLRLSLIHISEPTRLGMISYAVFCL